MVDEDLGAATLVYEGPDGETIEETVENEHVAYFQDHWIVKVDEGSEGADTVRRIPAERVFYVERDVEAFEEEIGTVLDDVQDVAGGVEDELRTVRSRIESVAGGVQSGLFRGRRRGGASEDEAVTRIEVATGETVDERGDETRDDPGDPDDEEPGLPDDERQEG